MDNMEEKVTLKERMTNWKLNFKEKHPKLGGVLAKIGIGVVAVVGGAAIGYTIGHRDGTALADFAEQAADTATDLVEDVTDVVESVSDAI